MDTDTFHEEQRFTQIWIQIILYFVWAGVTGVSIALVATKKTGPIPAICLFAFMTIFVVVFRNLKLQVSLRKDAISYRFFPIQWKYRNISRVNIESMELIDYNPISDYGGWGIRFGKKGAAYTVKGNHGLYIRRADKSSVLIGTSKPKEMEDFLQKH
ncbi:MAG TPA: hypothetical protein VKU83_04410 [Puia sp.]|nr:hypothetical protein [Puia sp.]